MNNQRLDIPRAARLLGVSPKTLRHKWWRIDRQIPTWKDRNRVFFIRKELEAWLAAQVRKAE